MAAISSAGDFNHATDCSVCFESRPLVPFSEVAGETHAFCQNCINTILASPTPRCPICRRNAVQIPVIVANPLNNPAQAVEAARGGIEERMGLYAIQAAQAVANAGIQPEELQPLAILEDPALLNSIVRITLVNVI